jgi:hypothetical protein
VGKHLIFYAKQSDLTHVYFFDMSMILLLYKETYFNANELDSCVLSICVSLLHEFKNVFPDKIPSGLPSIKGIEHQINLVPSLVILNRPSYECNPKKTTEL